MIFFLYFNSARLKHEESELKTKQSDLKSTAKGYEKDKVAFEAMRKDLAKIEVFVFYNLFFVVIISNILIFFNMFWEDKMIFYTEFGLFLSIHFIMFLSILNLFLCRVCSKELFDNFVISRIN